MADADTDRCTDWHALSGLELPSSVLIFAKSAARDSSWLGSLNDAVANCKEYMHFLGSNDSRQISPLSNKPLLLFLHTLGTELGFKVLFTVRCSFHFIEPG